MRIEENLRQGLQKMLKEMLRRPAAVHRSSSLPPPFSPLPSLVNRRVTSF